MLSEKEFNELKEIYSKILKVNTFENKFKEIKTIAALDAVFSDKGVFCVAAVFNYETLELIEKKELSTKEIIHYSPRWIAFREGAPMIEVYKLLETKPDVILISKQGAINPKKVSTPSYVGILINKPTIGVSKDLIEGKLEENKIIFKTEQKGFAIQTKEYSRPIYISPGFGISLEKCKEIVEHCTKEYKMPLPIHLTHKFANKIKK